MSTTRLQLVGDAGEQVLALALGEQVLELHEVAADFGAERVARVARLGRHRRHAPIAAAAAPPRAAREVMRSAGIGVHRRTSREDQARGRAEKSSRR